VLQGIRYTGHNRNILKRETGCDSSSSKAKQIEAKNWKIKPAIIWMRARNWDLLLNFKFLLVPYPTNWRAWLEC